MIEQIASDAYDADGPFDDHGRVLVTSEALTRITHRAQLATASNTRVMRNDNLHCGGWRSSSCRYAID
jgi:hypothetical protein